MIGGRYGLSSKEFRPAHVKAVFDELARFDDPTAGRPKRRFTVGIRDDVTGLSLDVDESFRSARPEGEVQAMFFGLGADGTVGANKASVKIIGEHTDLFSPGLLRLRLEEVRLGDGVAPAVRAGTDPLDVPHRGRRLRRLPPVRPAREDAGARPRQARRHLPAQQRRIRPTSVWDQLPPKVQQQIVDKGLDVWAIDAYRVAKEHGLGTRINTVMQPCFFALAGVLPVDEAIGAHQGVGRAELRARRGRRSSSATTRRSTTPSPHSPASTCPRRRRRTAPAHRAARRPSPTSSTASPSP